MVNRLIEMRPMEKYRFLTQNHKVCPKCAKNKSLKTFHEKSNDTIRDICNRCQKKVHEQEIMKMVISILNKLDI